MSAVQNACFGWSSVMTCRRRLLRRPIKPLHWSVKWSHDHVRQQCFHDTVVIVLHMWKNHLVKTSQSYWRVSQVPPFPPGGSTGVWTSSCGHDGDTATLLQQRKLLKSSVLLDFRSETVVLAVKLARTLGGCSEATPPAGCGPLPRSGGRSAATRPCCYTTDTHLRLRAVRD